MPWAKFDDQFDRDEDIEDYDIPASAIGLFACSITFCSRRLTDGLLPKDKAIKLPGGDKPANVAKLIEAGWWTVQGDDYYVPNYLKYNPSKAEIEHQKELKSIAGRQGGTRSAETKRQAKDQAPATADAKAPATVLLQQNSKQNSSSRALPVPSRPVPSRIRPESIPGPSPREERERGASAPTPPAAPPVQSAKFQPPTLAETQALFAEKQWPAIEAEKFWYHYDGNGWTQKSGKKLVSWTSAAHSWILRGNEFPARHSPRNGNGSHAETIDEAYARNLAMAERTAARMHLPLNERMISQ